MWQKVKIIGGAILALLVIIIALQNIEQVETRLLFVSVRMPRAVLLFGTLVAGFALGVLAAGRLVAKSKPSDT